MVERSNPQRLIVAITGASGVIYGSAFWKRWRATARWRRISS